MKKLDESKVEWIVSQKRKEMTVEELLSACHIFVQDKPR